MTDQKLSQTIVEALEDVKGIDITLIDLQGITDMADQMVLATGSSRRQVKALADRVIEKCREAGFRPIGVEGESAADWILIDFADVLVHVMLPDAREFYDLERLWTATLSSRENAADHED